MSQRTRTILMYSRSRGGKTTLIGELAEHVKVRMGLKSLVYSIDRGGSGPIYPHIKLGLIDFVDQQDTDPWVFLNAAAQGKVRDPKSGKWVKTDLTQYGMVAFESLSGFSDALMASLADKAAQGINVGGGANVSLQIQGDGETLKIGGSNPSHYNIVQTRILDECGRSQKLSVPYIVWTAGVSKDDDQNASGKVIGPAICGKALTAEFFRHIDLAFRLDCFPSEGGKPERHILYLGNSVDVKAGNAVGLGNTRTPMGSTLPPTIEPASLVKALTLIEEEERKAEEILKTRLASLSANPKE